MQEQKDRARAAWKGSGQSATAGLWFDIKDRVGTTEFLGYAMESAQGEITALVKDGKEVSALTAGESGKLIVNQTPFYGESGGQVGDKGTITSKQGKASVTDTQKPLDGVFVHEVTVAQGSLKVGDTVDLAINTGLRNRIRANHSATHLLHAALRHQLGEHITQKGSLVSEDRLRFDITNPKAVSREELVSVEAEVNHYVAQQSPATTKLMSQADAIAAGAMALFGEKYGAEVRVLAMGKTPDGSDFSVELCGGTHVGNTGDIGLFKIVSEGSVSAGVRRIEAVTGEGVRGYVQEQLQKLQEQLQALIEENKRLSEQVKRPPTTRHDLPLDQLKTLPLGQVIGFYEKESQGAQSFIEQFQEANKKLTKEAAEAKKQAAMADGGEDTIESIGQVKLASRQFAELDAKSLRDLANAMQQKHTDAVSVLLAANEGKASIIVAIGKDLTGKVDAPTLVKAAVEAVGGKGGGGRPDFAQGGGPEGDKLDDALGAIRQSLAA